MLSKLLRKVIATTLLIASTAYVSIIAPDLHNSYLRKEVGGSTVQVIVNERGGGTGFAVKGKSGKSYIMTNKHVCDGAGGKVRIKQDGEKGVIRKVVYIDSFHDICLVQGVDKYDALDIGSEPEKGDLIYVVGHPGLRQLTVSKGEYIGYEILEMPNFDVVAEKDCNGRFMELPILFQIMLGRSHVCMESFRSYSITAPVYRGNSGSPVVNKFGNVIGILFAGNPEQEHNNYVVPLAQVKRVLERF